MNNVVDEVERQLTDLLPSALQWRVVQKPRYGPSSDEKILVQIEGAHLNTKNWYDLATDAETIVYDVATLCDKVDNR